jgi:hypothetical protein
MHEATADRHPAPRNRKRAGDCSGRSFNRKVRKAPRKARKEKLAIPNSAMTIQRNSQTFFASFAAFLCDLSG